MWNGASWTFKATVSNFKFVFLVQSIHFCYFTGYFSVGTHLLTTSGVHTTALNQRPLAIMFGRMSFRNHIKVLANGLFRVNITTC